MTAMSPEYRPESSAHLHPCRPRALALALAFLVLGLGCGGWATTTAAGTRYALVHPGPARGNTESAPGDTTTIVLGPGTPSRSRASSSISTIRAC
jgi:hypothetical protein